MNLIIAGYTAAPQGAGMLDYYRQLVTSRDGNGLEFAWSGPDTPNQLAPVLAMLPADWSITLNDIPATWRATAGNPKFGLGSPDEAGRLAAMAMLREIHTAIDVIHQRMGRAVVSALEIHAAPGFDHWVVHPSAEAFKRSMGEALQLDWGTTDLLLEHADAFIEGQTPAKGFLPLAEEIEVLSAFRGSSAGLSLNWGRSMIELRDADRVIEHTVAASASGLLKGFTFSGSAAVDNPCGVAWADSHLPFQADVAGGFNEPASGMALRHVEETLPYLGDCKFIAIKTNWPAQRTDPAERAASVLANLDTLMSVLRRDATLTPRLATAA